MSRWIPHFDAFIDFLTYVFVCAPDRFAKETYLQDHEQLTLHSAFDELRTGLAFVEERITDRAVIEQLNSELEAAYALYLSGDDIAGSHRLQDLEVLILKNVRRRRR